MGRVPLIAFLVGVGLLICAGVDALSRATETSAQGVYWAAVLLFVVPIFARLAQSEPSKGERLTLVCLLGMAFYGLKLIRDSFLFTIPDESIHAYNAEQIVDSHHLFGVNPLQQISTDFPGLEGATSALMTLTGLSSFAAGSVLIGVAKLVLMAGLFLLFCRISGSPRIAGLGAAIYAANSNFLIFTAQYSYESLALPLLVVVLMAVAEREHEPRQEDEPQRSLSRWALPIGLLTAAIVVTHHLSSYALAAILAAVAVAYAIGLGIVRWPNPWPYVLLTLALSAAWLVASSADVGNYLGPVLSDVFSGIIDAVTGESGTRGLFESGGGGTEGTSDATPLIGRIPSILSVLLLLIALPFGLREVWRRQGRDPFSIVLSIAAVAFFATLSLRFISSAWETGSRAAEFLFIGLAFVVAFAYLFFYSWVTDNRPSRARLGHGALSLAFGIVVIGGAIAGWPWDARLQEPLRVKAEGGVIESEPLTAARWAAREIPDGRFAASSVQARLMLAQGDTYADAEGAPDIEDVLITEDLEAWNLPYMRELNLRYVVSDQRRRHNAIDGYWFSNTPAFGGPEDVYSYVSTLKWERQVGQSARIYDSGYVVIHDLEARP